MAGDDTTKTTKTGSGDMPDKPGEGNKRARRLIVWGAIVAVAAVLLTVSLVYTEQSSFCGSCHEMGPYYSAWVSGPHAKAAECTDCHLDAGIIAHLAHKPIALKEVWNHFFSDNRFPNFAVDVPNSRCVRCHSKVPEKTGSLFSHAKHETKATCKNCHSQAGHTVTLASLDAAGVLKSGAKAPVPGGMTPSSITGHKKVICQDCHDQAKMKCSSCHQPPHENRGECSQCHTVGSSFVAGHPGGDNKNCAQCHKAPANHFGSACSTCHTPGVPFKNATFTHKARVGDHSYKSFACVKCHPDGSAKVYCSCHKGNPPSGD